MIGFGLVFASVGAAIRGWGYVRIRDAARRTPWSANSVAEAEALVRRRKWFANRAAVIDRVRTERDERYIDRLIRLASIGAVVCVVVGVVLFAVG